MRKFRKRKVQTIFKICRPGGKKKPPAVFIADGWRCALPLRSRSGSLRSVALYPLLYCKGTTNSPERLTLFCSIFVKSSILFLHRLILFCFPTATLILFCSGVLIPRKGNDNFPYQSFFVSKGSHPFETLIGQFTIGQSSVRHGFVKSHSTFAA